MANFPILPQLTSPVLMYQLRQTQAAFEWRAWSFLHYRMQDLKKQLTLSLENAKPEAELVLIFLQLAFDLEISKGIWTP